MRHGGNYERHLESAMTSARAGSDRLEAASLAAEGRFRRLLPFNETTLDVSPASLNHADVVSLREAFREAHRKHSDALNLQASIEDEYFEFLEDFH